MKPDVSVAGALVSAFQFLPTAWKRLWAWLGLTVLLTAAVMFPFMPGLIGLITFLGALLLLADLYVVALEALQAPGFKTRIGLVQRTRAEWRMIASLGLVALLLAIAALLLLVLMMGAAFGVASAGPGFQASDPGTWAAAVDRRGRIILALVGGGCVLAFLWLLLRLAYAPVASIARGRVQALSAWPLSRGVSLRTAIGLAAINVPALLVAIAGRYAAGLPHIPIFLIGGLVAGILLAGVALPLNVGLMTYLYRQITRDAPDA